MITLYRKQNDTEADAIESRFKDLVLAYKTEIISEETSPRIKDGKAEISGKLAIESWFLQLEKELKWQRSLSGDGCYIHPDTGDVC